jgi:hypothetical protein
MTTATAPIDTYSEAHRKACEARYWLDQGYTTAERVEELMGRIAARRGKDAADELREEMRRQWPNRKAAKA